MTLPTVEVNVTATVEDNTIPIVDVKTTPVDDVNTIPAVNINTTLVFGANAIHAMGGIPTKEEILEIIPREGNRISHEALLEKLSVYRYQTKSLERVRKHAKQDTRFYKDWRLMPLISDSVVIEQGGIDVDEGQARSASNLEGVEIFQQRNTERGITFGELLAKSIREWSKSTQNSPQKVQKMFPDGCQDPDCRDKPDHDCWEGIDPWEYGEMYSILLRSLLCVTDSRRRYASSS